MGKILGTTVSEGFRAIITQDDDLRVWFKGDLDIDFDGMNGFNGKPAAYMVDDKGAEYLSNGGMRMSGGKVVGVVSWWKDIVLQGPDGNPLVLPGGVIPSLTAYHTPSTLPRASDALDPKRQLDSAIIPYIVVPSFVIPAARGVVKGCKAACTYGGKRVFGMVGDVGPRSKVGEASVRMAELLGIPTARRSGGLDAAEVLYELWPDTPAEIDGKRYPLMRANGTFVS